jgi:hypothetical protein
MKMVSVEIPKHIVDAACDIVSDIVHQRYITNDFAVQFALEKWVGECRQREQSTKDIIATLKPRPLSPKEMAVKEFGAEVVSEAESYYETYYDKEFWRDLNFDERSGYLNRAKYNLEKQDAS